MDTHDQLDSIIQRLQAEAIVYERTADVLLSHLFVLNFIGDELMKPKKTEQKK